MGRESRLLIVDDNATTRYAMRRVLERHGYQVLEAGTGSDGLALVAGAMPDALILDVNLPDMSGFDIARQLRTDPNTALLPLIHVSAASIETGDIITGLDAGGDAYLIHPVDPDVLLATLRTLLRVRDTERALPEGGHIGIRTFSTDASQHPELAAGRYIGLCVSDDGTGIDPAVVDKVFDPFFTTKPQGRGTGLGLSSIYGFALQSGGDAHIRSTLGVGTDVTLLLPAADGETSLAPSAASEDSARLAGHEHVLVVEDMPSVRMLIAETLIEAGYRCSQAGDVETAQALLEADPSIDLLLTDVGLPRLSGRQLAEWARRSRPALPVVLMTGYAEKASSREGFVDERMELVLKPFEGADLLGKIRALLDNG
ncbi:response regulator [Stutzerimonas stutzeri]|uniref:response regulator n=1 Tax=Stutzerimonas stutzeri TaxID=316 RepID=UPI0005F144D7|nr:response regulator [Stutzerimonas stutzeri]MCQ4224086.1 response regulator [Stutzerimonas stutzeri]OWG37780.1 hypothetical protein CAQ69_14190 [Stutzerimonas stutzeri]